MEAQRRVSQGRELWTLLGTMDAPGSLLDLAMWGALRHGRSCLLGFWGAEGKSWLQEGLGEGLQLPRAGVLWTERESRIFLNANRRDLGKSET